MGANQNTHRDRPRIVRTLLRLIEEELGRDVCALLVGPYEVGKSALAREIAERFGISGQFFNARKPEDRDRLAGCDGDACNSEGKLIVIDEVHEFADVLDLIQSEIDAARSSGKRIGRFLLLGSSSVVAEQLAANRLGTRARVHRLAPIDLSELPRNHPDLAQIAAEDPEGVVPIGRPEVTISLEALWLRGGFPESLLAKSDDASFDWRERYLIALCARGYTHLNPALAASSVRTFLERIAARQGEILDVNHLPAVERPCLPHFEDLGLIRQLRPWFTNEGKRLAKPPKVYIRDSGLLHALLRRRTHEEIRASSNLYGHSWEGFCVENLITAAGPKAVPYFYRSDDQGEEVDLVLEFLGGTKWAIELKGADTKVSSGFEIASRSVGASRKFVVRPIPESYEGGSHHVMTLHDAMNAVRLGPS